MLYSIFKGCAVLRDYSTSSGDIIKSEDFNASEHLSANFITDYLGAIGADGNTIATAGAVVSDKPYIYRILSDLNRKLEYGIENGILVKNSVEEPVIKVTLGEILTHENST
jgi:hypothetical protein